MRNSVINNTGNTAEIENFVFDIGGFVSLKYHKKSSKIVVNRPMVAVIHLKSGAADIAQWRIGVSEWEIFKVLESPSNTSRST